MESAYIHSYQSLGTLDGPGVRFVVFLSGCPLRCIYCHNPDTWNLTEGERKTSDEVLERILRCRNYFGSSGGVTVSGGEPLLQAEFVGELFEKCHKAGIHTALDTSGCLPDAPGVEKLLAVTDLVLLDIKFTLPEDYKTYTGADMEDVLRFLRMLDEKRIKTWIRHVVVPSLNDSGPGIMRLKEICAPFTCIEKLELLPFRKLCIEKYERLGIPFRLRQTPEAGAELMEKLNKLITQ